jgi:restriction system protein
MLALLQATGDKIDTSWPTSVILTYSIIVLLCIVGLFVVLAIPVVVIGLFRRRRLARSGIDDIDKMGGRVFEQYLEVLFERRGYKVERTKFVGDFGGDLVLRKDGTKTVVQAKRYTKNVGVKAVQEVVAAKGYYDCDAAMVVTNSTYTNQARELARKNNVDLWDRERLISELEAAHVRDTVVGARAGDAAATVERIAPVRAPGEAPPPLATVATCRMCAKVLSSGERSYCETNRERFRGEMFCFRHQRSRRPMARE